MGTIYFARELIAFKLNYSFQSSLYSMDFESIVDSDAKDMLNGHSVLVKKPDLAITYSQK
jgi:hypothetical protein